MAAQRTSSGGTPRESDFADWAPLLDEGVNRLSRRDRDPIVLRFFEQKSTREVAQSLGISEPAAAKRLERAVAKLRDFFARRGATVSAPGLAATLVARSAEAAPPPQLAASIAGSAAARAGASAAASSIAKGAIVAMAYAKAKTVLIATLAGVLFVGGAGVVIVKLVGSHQDAALGRPSAAPARVPTANPAVTFSDGSTASLVAITNNPDTGTWWAADGTAIDPPREAPVNNNHLSAPASRNFYLVVRHESPALRDTSLIATIRQPHMASGITAKPVGPNGRALG
jgi:hypothetical protein